jgi:hypothetical protein
MIDNAEETDSTENNDQPITGDTDTKGDIILSNENTKGEGIGKHTPQQKVPQGRICVRIAHVTTHTVLVNSNCSQWKAVMNYTRMSPDM